MKKINRPWLAHYDQGVPAEIDIPDISLVDLFRNAVQTYGESVCVIFGDEQLTYQQVDLLSERVARFLISRGLNKGDRVGIYLANTPEFVIGYYGILKAGGVVMALNPAYTPAEVETLVSESGVQFMILNASAYEAINSEPIRKRINSMVVVDGENLDLNSADITWNEMLKQQAGGEPVEVDVRHDDPAVFQYSGGTTGTPKCAIGLHRNLIANVYQFNQWLVNTSPGEETVLVAIPIYHVYGMVLGMNLAVKMGARMVLIPNPLDLDHLLAAAEKHQATVFPGVPSLYAAINHYPPVLEGKYDLSSIKACISGSATLPIRVKREFEALTHGHLVEGYGLSEAPTATHCNPVLGENREGSIGLPLPNVDCKVVDMETGETEFGPNQVGELIIRGPQVMAGYFGRPEESQMAVRNGWLYTGDIVRMDEDGYFYIVDRKKDVIKPGGFQVWPNEVEAVIRKHPDVQDVAVAGVVDQDGSEVVMAWVVLKKGASVTVDQIQTFCAEFLTRYKIPKWIEFRTTLPRTRVGKVLRRELVREHMTQQP